MIAFSFYKRSKSLGRSKGKSMSKLPVCTIFGSWRELEELSRAQERKKPNEQKRSCFNDGRQTTDARADEATAEQAAAE